MQRRAVLTAGISSLAVCSTASCSTLTLGTAASKPMANLSARAPQDKRHEAAWQRGFSGVRQAFKAQKLTLEGRWPADALGNFYRNGPARTERAGVQLPHWFDGDGMVQRFCITQNTITHQSQFIATEKYLREEAAGRFIYSSTGALLPHALAPRNNDSLNQANTALLPWQGKLLALWEAGSAYVLNPENLATEGVKTWRDDCAHLPFSAHPLLERDGSLWNFGYLPYLGQGTLVIYRIGTGNNIVQLGAIPLVQNGYIHSCAQTTDYLIFYLPPCVYEAGQTYLDAFKWRPAIGSKILLVHKRDLTARWLDAPAGFVFHFANAWQTHTFIYATLALYKNADLMLNAMAHVRGNLKPSIDHGVLTLVKISLTAGSVELTPSAITLEFPCVDPAVQGPSVIYGTHAGLGGDFLHDSLVAAHPIQGQLSHYCFGRDVVVEEPVLVKTARKQYLIASFFNMAEQYSGLGIFNAQHLADGPIALAKLPYVIPLGFHGCFIAA